MFQNVSKFNWSYRIGYYPNWMKLFEFAQNWVKLFHLAQIWKEVLLFAESWFSLLEFTQILPIYGNVSNFMQTWISSSNLLKFDWDW